MAPKKAIVKKPAKKVAAATAEDDSVLFEPITQVESTLTVDASVDILDVDQTDSKLDQSVDLIANLFSLSEKEFVAQNGDLTDNYMKTIADAEYDYRGSIAHHLGSFNEFTSKGIKEIMTENFTIERMLINKRSRTDEDKKVDKIKFTVKISNVKINKPVLVSYKTGKEQHPITPTMARIENRTYISPIYAEANIVATAYYKDGSEKIREAFVPSTRIAGIPTMVRGELCNTHNLSKEALLRLEDDPTDPGGYFIIKGGEWVINNLENMINNQFRIFKNVGHANEICRGSLISKPGDGFENSVELTVRYLQNGSLTFEITQRRFTKFQIPFYVLFRALGMASDKEICDNIVYDYDNPISDEMLEILEKAFKKDNSGKASIWSASRHMYDQYEVLTHLNRHIPSDYGAYPLAEAAAAIDSNNKEAIKYLNTELLRILDTVLLPHIGMTESSRMKKIKYLGYLIHKLLLVNMDLVESTDRDSYKFKRVHTAGQLYAKVFKTQYNFCIVLTIKNQFNKAFKHSSFDQVPLEQTFLSALRGSHLETGLIQAITSGDKTITVKRRKISNHLASQQLHRKNDLNTLSSLRQINTPNTSSASKQDERSDLMRRVHPTYTGYICVIQSADTGEAVGIHKQLTLVCSISMAKSSETLKRKILEDSEITPLNNTVPSDIYGKTKVFVNGDWIGIVDSRYAMAAKYRDMRRQNPPQIDAETTIFVDPLIDEINFWVDAGRLLRPLVIVHYTKSGQAYVKLTRQIIADLRNGRISMAALRQMNVIEYISPEEQLNCWVATSIEEVIQNADNPLVRYTHCDISINILGLAALTSPLSQHNQAPRITYQTNQVKQTCGWYAMNYPYRMDKNVFVQYENETPLITTIANKYISPNGSNVIMAIACYGGYNQEDSLIFSQHAIDRGLFKGSRFSYDQTELEPGELFTTPDKTITSDIKNHACYEKLVDGFVRRGTIIENDDVIIGKVVPNKSERKDDSIRYTDRSIVYRHHESAIVEDVVKPRNEEDNFFCKVKYRSLYPPSIGDKFCRLPSAEIMTKTGWVRMDSVTMNHEIATLNPLNDTLEYHLPTAVLSFPHDGPMYELKSQQINETCTMNHKMYIKKRDHINYELCEAINVMGKRVQFKKDCINIFPDIQFYTINNVNGQLQIRMDDWLDLLGIFIADGWLTEWNNICISGTKQRKVNHINDICAKLGVEVRQTKSNRPQGAPSAYGYELKHYIHSPIMYKELESMNLGAINKKLPDYVFTLSQRQSRILVESLLSGDGSVTNTNTPIYHTSSMKLADDFMRLVLLTGWSANMKLAYPVGTPYTIEGRHGFTNADHYRINIVKAKNNPMINHGHVHEQNGQSEKIIQYKGNVHCVTVPNHIVYIREDGTGHWTGNSARSG